MLYRDESTGKITYEPPFKLFGYNKIGLGIPYNKYLMLKRWENQGWDKKIYQWIKHHCKMATNKKIEEEG